MALLQTHLTPPHLSHVGSRGLDAVLQVGLHEDRAEGGYVDAHSTASFVPSYNQSSDLERVYGFAK